MLDRLPSWNYLGEQLDVCKMAEQEHIARLNLRARFLLRYLGDRNPSINPTDI